MSGLRFTARLFRMTLPAVLLATFGFGLGSALAALAAVMTSRFFAALPGGTQEPVQYAIAFLLASVAAQLSDFIWQAGLTLMDRILTTLLRINMLRGIYRRPGALPLPVTPGEAITRFRDDVLESCFYIHRFPLSLVDVATAAGIFAYLFTVQPLLAALGAAAIAGVFLAMRKLQENIVLYRDQVMERTEAVTGYLGEILSAVPVLQVAGAVPDALRRFRDLNQDREVVSLKERLQWGLLFALSENGFYVALGLVILAAAPLLARGQFSPAQFALFQMLLQQVGWRMWGVSESVAQLRAVGVYQARMAELAGGDQELVAGARLDFREEIPPEPAPARRPEDALEVLTVAGLTYRHPETGRGIADVSFTLPRGSFTVITGRIGSGKTTLVRTLLGLLPAEAGEVRWNGQVVTDPMAFFTPPRIAYTPQVPRIFSGSLRANILLGLAESDVDMEEAVAAAVLEPDVAQFPCGLETEVGSRGVKLSGGQVQRTAAARMFARQPALLVLDDISSALDSETEAELWRRLFAREGATVLCVSNRRAALERADQILLLDEGRLVAAGPLPELLRTSPAMRELWTAIAPDEKAEIAR
ncbi:ATP-binding cassette domain-containing protein [Symbiobacterium thermophilum]|uniref:ABC transporter ATP-binding protein n=1 Tax=Symbiobacterium thermophilum TaxID=2734 RepID=A0A953ID39_SYMTR|nr:ABC transporter ATP-binding protein [Symbiobacterium thermophilum]MBY6276070.1 ABC transporter ATP-binding protein [Symbiobacterium thermophilum]